MSELLHLIHSPDVLAYIIGVFTVLFLAIKLAHAFLGLLRDIDDYRVNRPHARHRSRAATVDESGGPAHIGARRSA